VNGVLSKLILVLAFFSQSTLAVKFINDKTADLPDFHRYGGYGDMLQREDDEFTLNDANRLTNVNLTPVVFSLNSATGWFSDDDVSPLNDYVLAAIMDSFWDEYDCSWSRYIYPVLWKNTTASENGPHDDSLLALASSNYRYPQLQDIRLQAEQTVNAGNWVFLNASQSVVEVDKFSYQWRQIAGKPILINRPDSIRAWVQTPSNITHDETLEFELVVTDDEGINGVAMHTVFVTATVN